MITIIFIHGVGDQSTNYSKKFFDKISKSYIRCLQKKGKTNTRAREMANNLIHKEILWADITTDLTNRYRQLQYTSRRKKHNLQRLKNWIDPLMIQIMYYIRDKNITKKRTMRILERIQRKIQGYRFKSTDKVIIIGHSLGSVIAFDYIFGFRKKYKLSKKINVDLFVTLGSPIPLFITAMGHPQSTKSLPKNINKWVNILDRRDGIARFFQPHLRKSKVKDIEVKTGWHPLKVGAHSKYFKCNKVSEIIANELTKLKIK